MRVVAAMSGGVDSSVAAALLATEGHDVIGLSMQLYDQREERQSFGSCCALDDLHDARRVARVLGIPHYVLNLERRFQETVVANFVSEYTAGRTPLPCTHCNSDLKFSTLLDRAEGLGAAKVATGHYARVEPNGRGRWLLKRSTDREKDQTYFLFSLTQAQLGRALFPVGELTKPEVRAHAAQLRLGVEAKPDSQEICFVQDGDYASFVERQAPAAARPGAIVDEQGRAVGSHRGIHRFTVGQRKGLGLSAPAPLYVLRLDAAEATVTVGTRSALECSSLTASSANWISDDPPAAWRPAAARIRHRHTPAPGRVRAIDHERAEFEFDIPQVAVTPGQAAVFYDGDTVLGGGWID
jgi:tRNA-specific 2-thiouridylase